MLVPFISHTTNPKEVGRNRLFSCSLNPLSLKRHKPRRLFKVALNYQISSGLCSTTASELHLLYTKSEPSFSGGTAGQLHLSSSTHDACIDREQPMKRKPSPIPVRLQCADVPDISYRTNLGLSLSDLAEAGVDLYDLDALRESNSEKSLMRPSSRANSPRKYS